MTGDEYNERNSMIGFWEKRFAIRRAASAVTLAVYLFLSTSVDLFHNEICMFGAEQPVATDVISHNEPCLACKFLAGHNSTEVNQSSILVGTEFIIISQSIPLLTTVNHNAWSYSIISRAPPLFTIS